MTRTLILVCGGREFNNRAAVFGFLGELDKRCPIGVVIEGGATGADRLARLWAFDNNVHVCTVNALWHKRGKRAGMDRNQAMLMLKPDAVVAFPGGRGTANMVQQALDAGIPVIRFEPKKD